MMTIKSNYFKVAVVFDTVVSSCDFINCQSVQMQVKKPKEGHMIIFHKKPTKGSYVPIKNLKRVT